METKNLSDLQNIHDLLVDSRKGYQEASERAEDGQVKQLLSSFGMGRVRLEAAIDEQIKQLKPDAPHGNGTIKGDLHRAWIDIRTALSTSDDVSSLNECENGENFLLMRYEEVLKKDLDPGIRRLVESQRAEVQGNVDRVKALRNQFEKAES